MYVANETRATTNGAHDLKGYTLLSYRLFANFFKSSYQVKLVNEFKNEHLTKLINSLSRIDLMSFSKDSSQPMNLMTRIPASISLSDLMRESLSLYRVKRNRLLSLVR